ncbi:5-carboxymethyl-2-hydroxymuconate Delta-isomerase [Seonamhaeicola maritimus]|uniref:5-carboxymethyl-2-hydroxymuconate isomerase n=1 Tax=Seonamhaeicola maritimus TaxID=2591822 RepID=A0A5C7GDR1_9FLAO|nr:5-carboxymethyl-2-hydroxymuconate isomerase [Seonamhaeicola maritimus]TXG34689.1 5-carboxymethyl-2-hydroxymuconate isomerase [Seonamhaeicola maritimus]
MPHLIVECSENILKKLDPDKIIQSIYNTVTAVDSFENNVMVRIIPYKYYTTLGGKDDFIYIFANILEGRTLDNKKTFSKNVIALLKEMFPDVPKISINIREFERATFVNNSML